MLLYIYIYIKKLFTVKTYLNILLYCKMILHSMYCVDYRVYIYTHTHTHMLTIKMGSGMSRIFHIFLCGLCDTEDWSNDAENTALITEVYIIFFYDYFYDYI